LMPGEQIGNTDVPCVLEWCYRSIMTPSFW
jgi:hypothetical protein